jgi:chemotaxis protein MotB
VKRVEEEEHENAERWLLTYSDLITLLMIFFIVLYAMSNIDAKKYSNMAQSMNIAMGGGGKSIIGTSDNSSIKDSSPAVITEEQKLSGLKGEVDQYLNDAGLSGNVSTQLDERGLVIRMENSILFDSGKADIKPESKNILLKIGQTLNKIVNYIRVEGHTDNVPIRSSLFRSNWDLSAARATNVVELFVNESKVSPARLSEVGYGEYRPVATNETDAGRAKNRRVDIVIINSKFNQVEKTK